jgi:hypothetical protein
MAKPAAAEKLSASVEKLAAEYAAAQAKADAIKARLNKAEAVAAGEPAAESGLEMLWKAAPEMARTRSSQYKCRVAWNRIPPAARPRVPVMLHAMRAWARCDEWTKAEGQYVPALDRWIKERRWEDLPAGTVVDPGARYRSPKLPELPPTPPEERATPEDIRAMIAAVETAMSSFPSR